MIDEAKKLIESVHVYKPNEIAFSSIHRDYVSKSDFDRVVEELTKPKAFDIDCAGNAMIRVVVDGDGISVTNAMNGGGHVIPINKIIITTNN
jgi:hypothetical protein